MPRNKKIREIRLHGTNHFFQVIFLDPIGSYAVDVKDFKTFYKREGRRWYVTTEPKMPDEVPVLEKKDGSSKQEQIRPFWVNYHVSSEESHPELVHETFPRPEGVYQYKVGKNGRLESVLVAEPKLVVSLSPFDINRRNKGKMRVSR